MKAQSFKVCWVESLKRVRILSSTPQPSSPQPTASDIHKPFSFVVYNWIGSLVPLSHCSMVAKPLPEPLDGEAIKQHLVGYKHHILSQCLGDQQPVERVLVGDVHFTGEPSMVNADRQ